MAGQRYTKFNISETMHFKVSTLLFPLGVLAMAVANPIARVAYNVNREATIPDSMSIDAGEIIADPVGIR